MVFLRSGKWSRVVRTRRRDLCLETACFCGKLWRLNPDGSPRPAYFHDPENVDKNGRQRERTRFEKVLLLDEFIYRSAVPDQQDANGAKDGQNESEQAPGDNVQANSRFNSRYGRTHWLGPGGRGSGFGRGRPERGSERGHARASCDSHS